MHLLAPVADLGKKHGMMDFSFRRFLHATSRDPSGLAPRIDFEGDGLERAVLHLPIFESDHKGCHAMHDRPATREQETRSFGRARHQWMLLPV